MIKVMIVIALAGIVAVVWFAVTVQARKNDPVLRVARAKAQQAMQTELYERRSRIRAEQIEDEARAAMKNEKKGT